MKIVTKIVTIDDGDDNHVQEAGRRHPGEDRDDQHRRRLHPCHQALVALIISRIRTKYTMMCF